LPVDGTVAVSPLGSAIPGIVRSRSRILETGSAVPDYPGRYQVDPTTGQVVDTGNASMPGNPVVSVTVAPPPPPPAPAILPPPPPPAEEPPVPPPAP
jgi:hypothetical protein